MALVIRELIDIYDKMNNVFADFRVREMCLMSNPFKPLIVIAIYFYFILRAGPKLMENRKPMQLDSIIKYYNLLQVVFCSYISLKGYYHSFGQGYRITCEAIDYSIANRHAVELTKIAHLYFLSKVIDLLDTVFFVLKKKQTHVSFLHCYHHGGMVALSWLGAKYFAGGQSAFMGVINSFVHIIMYTYYFLTSVDNKFKQSSWKKHITQLQMIQFGLMALHWLTLLISPDCGYPKFVGLFMLPQNFFIFILFYDFYRKTYYKKLEVTESGVKTELNNNKTAENDSKYIDFMKKKKNPKVWGTKDTY